MENFILLKDIAKYAVPSMVSTFTIVFSLLINMRILGSIDVNYLYILALYLPINYYLISLYESFRASSIAVSSISKSVEDKYFITNNIFILIFFIFITFFISSILFVLCQKIIVRLLHVYSFYQIIFIHFGFCMILVSSFICLNHVFIAIFYGIGKPRTSMLLTIAAAIASCLLTYLLSFYFKLRLFSFVFSTFISYLGVIFFSILSTDFAPKILSFIFSKSVESIELIGVTTCIPLFFNIPKSSLLPIPSSLASS